MASERVTLADLAADPGRTATLGAPEAAAVLAEMAALQTALAARLAVTNSTALAPIDADSALLTVEDVVKLTGYSRRKVYTMSEESSWKPFAVRQGLKTLRFRPGLRAFLTEPRASRRR